MVSGLPLSQHRSLDPPGPGAGAPRLGRGVLNQFAASTSGRFSTFSRVSCWIWIFFLLQAKKRKRAERFGIV